MKATCILFLNLVISITILAQSSKEADSNETYNQSSECNCPEPTNSQYLSVCMALYDNEYEGSVLGYLFIDELWKMSCAIPGVDTKEEAAVKIRCMWMKYRKQFRCYNFPNSLASDKNVLKFSMELGMTSLLTLAVKNYKLDMNFIDPADDKTILDFIKEHREKISSWDKPDPARLEEYDRVYKMLRDYGVKHANELK